MKNRVILGALIALTLTGCSNEVPTTDVVVNEVIPVRPVVTPVEDLEVILPDLPDLPIEEEEVVETPTVITYRVTAYCACEKCCGRWAFNRPTDENGEPIVYGAAGVALVNGYSCAGTLPFGTKVELDGYGVVEVQDRTANWIVDKYGENIIDIFINDHEKAWDFGEQYLEGVIIND